MTTRWSLFLFAVLAFASLPLAGSPVNVFPYGNVTVTSNSPLICSGDVYNLFGKGAVRGCGESADVLFWDTGSANPDTVFFNTAAPVTFNHITLTGNGDLNGQRTLQEFQFYYLNASSQWVELYDTAPLAMSATVGNYQFSAAVTETSAQYFQADFTPFAHAYNGPRLYSLSADEETSTPEPVTAGLVGAALLGLGVARIRRK